MAADVKTADRLGQQGRNRKDVDLRSCRIVQPKWGNRVGNNDPIDRGVRNRGLSATGNIVSLSGTWMRRISNSLFDLHQFALDALP